MHALRQAKKNQTKRTAVQQRLYDTGKTTILEGGSKKEATTELSKSRIRSY